MLAPGGTIWILPSRYIKMPEDVGRSALAHNHKLAAGRITVTLGSQTLAHRRFVDFRGVKGSVIAKIFGQGGVYVKIRHDTEGFVPLKETRAKELEIIDNPGPSQRRADPASKCRQDIRR